MKALDTNVLVRFLVKDDEHQSKIVYKLFKQAAQSLKVKGKGGIYFSKEKYMKRSGAAIKTHNSNPTQ